MAVDRIRLAKHTGRLGCLRAGDRFCYRECVFQVIRSEVLMANETEIRQRFFLLESEAASCPRWELMVIATSQPTISLVGRLRRMDSDQVNDLEDSVDDSDIVLMRPLANMNEIFADSREPNG